MTGAIKEGISHRMANTHPSCEEWLQVADEEGESLLKACDPFDGEGVSSLRVILIPVVNGLFGDGGHHKVTIVAFALFFLEDFDASDCTGSDCDIVGRFIRTQMHTGGLGYAPLHPDSALTLVKLVE
jgi:hypothetical protein